MTAFDRKTLKTFRDSADQAIATDSTETIELVREDCGSMISAVSGSIQTLHASKQEAIDENHPAAFADGLGLLAESQIALHEGLCDIAQALDAKIAE